MWSTAEILVAIRQHLVSHDRALRDQQSLRGIDSLREIDLHPLVSQSFTRTEQIAFRECHYPTSSHELPKATHRDRCDLVMIPTGKKSLYDPVDAHKELQSASGTLFEAIAAPPVVSQSQCVPEDAFWIEIKAIAQHRYVDGVPVPNAKYAHELLSGPIADVVKLASDPQIRHAGVLALLFTELEEAGIHDLSIAIREMIDRDLPVGMPDYETFPIVDLGGNAWCTLGLVPLRL